MGPHCSRGGIGQKYISFQIENCRTVLCDNEYPKRKNTCFGGVDFFLSRRIIDNQVSGYRHQPLLLTSRPEGEKMIRHLAQCLCYRSQLRFSIATLSRRRAHVIDHFVRPLRRIRLFCVVHFWIPHSLENRCHILVQTSPVLCHYLSFRANEFSRCLHNFRRQA